MPKKNAVTSDGDSRSLPAYLAGTLLLRGRTRLMWTAVLLVAQVVFGLAIQQAVGHHSNAVIAPFALALAWMWGSVPGAAYSLSAAALNVLATRWMDLPSNVWWSITLDAVAVAVTAFLIGHIAKSLERALGARARAVHTVDQLAAQANERMLTITDQVPIGLYRTTPAGEIIGGNDALMRILGFDDKESMLATNVWDHYVDIDERSSKLHNYAAGEQSWNELALKQVDGTPLWVRDWAVAVLDENGEPLHFDGVLEDITEQRRADERFRAAFEDSPHGMAISTADGVVVRANAAIATMMGRSPEELRHLHYSAYTHDDELDVTPSALAKAAAGEVVRYEKRLQRSDGSFFWAMITLAPIKDPVGAQLFISHVIDVTDRHLVREALENLVRSKDELIASVSHELRTPLTVVHGLAQELDANWMSFSVPEQKEFISMIAQQSAEVAHIVEDLLVAARADIGKLPIHPETLDLRGEIDKALASVPDLDARLLDGAANPPVAFADPNRVRQILRNLLANAGRYGGPQVQVRYGGGDRAWLEVADNGPGVPPAEVAKIFEPYQRAHNAEGQPMSVGLGLTVSRTLAEMMGGSLEYRFHDGWSVFRLELPAPGAVHTGRAVRAERAAE
ncbi:MAG: PAS domain S-box protein [Acidimicrobiia bacterium]|nr:PAS domain S-box protein [Acidimicrobiia bacterium]